MSETDSKPPLSELARRIEQRLTAMNKTARGASIEAGLSASAIRNIFEGKSASPRGETLSRLAAVLDVSEHWLLKGDGPATPAEVAPLRDEGQFRPPPQFFDNRDKMRVYASAEGGQGTLILSVEPIEHLPRPHTLEGIPEAYAILIEGESMVPAFEPGDVAWVNPRLGARKGSDVILYGLDDRTGEARATIKRLVSSTDAHWTLQQWNPAKKFKLDRGIWRECHRVVGKFSRR